jgi:hypothetical protein
MEVGRIGGEDIEHEGGEGEENEEENECSLTVTTNHCCI